MKQYIIMFVTNYGSRSFYTGSVNKYLPYKWNADFNNSVTVFPDIHSANKLIKDIYKFVGREHAENYNIYEYISPSVGDRMTSVKEQHIDNLRFVVDAYQLNNTNAGKLIEAAINYIQENCE